MDTVFEHPSSEPSQEKSQRLAFRRSIWKGDRDHNLDSTPLAASAFSIDFVVRADGYEQNDFFVIALREFKNDSQIVAGAA